MRCSSGSHIGAARDQQSKIVDPRLKTDVVVLDLAGPIARHGKFDADAGHPSDVKQGLGGERVTVFVVDDDFGLAESHAARDVRQDWTEGDAGASPRGGEVIVRRVVRCERDRRIVVRGDERQIAFESQHEAAGVLDIEAGLIAADEAGDAVPEKFALRRQRNGGGSKAATAVAEMKTDIGAGPVV